MDNWTLTKVYEINNHKLVIADNIAEAVKLYTAYIGEKVEITSTKLLWSNSVLPEYDAIIQSGKLIKDGEYVIPEGYNVEINGKVLYITKES